MSRSNRKKAKQNLNPIYTHMSKIIYKGFDIAIEEITKKFNIDKEKIVEWKKSRSLNELMNKILQEKV